MLENDLVHVHVPANLTRKFQPLDININGVAKGSLKDQFQTWYTDEVQKQMDNGKGVYEVDVDTRLSRISPYMHVGQLASMISYGILKKRLRIDLKLPQLRRH